MSIGRIDELVATVVNYLAEKESHMVINGSSRQICTRKRMQPP